MISRTLAMDEGMGTAKTAGRIVGTLIVVQIISAVLVNFFLAAPLFGAPGFLVNAAAHSSQIAASVLLGLAVAAISVGVAIGAFPVIGRQSKGMALWLLALASAGLAVAAVEQISVMSMLSLSEAYAKAGAAERQPFEGLRIVVASARNWSHYVALVMGGSMIFVLYSALFRFSLVPRALAAFGIAAATLQIIAVSMPLFGHGIVFLMLAPLAVSQLVLALWLVAKGFRRGPVASGGDDVPGAAQKHI